MPLSTAMAEWVDIGSAQAGVQGVNLTHQIVFPGRGTAAPEDSAAPNTPPPSPAAPPAAPPTPTATVAPPPIEASLAAVELSEEETSVAVADDVEGADEIVD